MNSDWLAARNFDGILRYYSRATLLKRTCPGQNEGIATAETSHMEQEATAAYGNSIWGCIWILYAFCYGWYFRHVAQGLKPDSAYVTVPGSPERLMAKRVWCYRFAALMTFPSLLEAIRPSLFTSAFIALMPCVFGVWVMRAVWREVFRSEIPKSARINERKSH